MEDWREALRHAIGAACGESPRRVEWQVLGGGEQNTFKLSGFSRAMFIKLAPAAADRYAAEADGLRALGGDPATDAVDASRRRPRVPRVFAHGEAGEYDFLAIEYFDLQAASAGDPRKLGAALARLHADVGESFGWPRDNFIGPTPQQNRPHADWVEFWRERRLLPQLRLAHQAGFRGEAQRRADTLLADFGAFFTDYRPRPSLLHGDLWHGNIGFIAAAEPVLYDPAVYRGDAEADLAMTELFGGISPDMLAVYREHAGIDAGYAVRKHLYNLYHVLNHLVIFGGAYAAQAAQLIDRVSSELP